MAQVKVQNFENHTRFVPPYHMFALPVFLINFVWRLVQLKDGINFASIMNLLLGAAFVVAFLYARLFSLTVQDRLPDLRSRIPEFTVPQLISLRFAGDDELPGLARQVLDERLNDRKTIKRRVKNWQADFLRA